MTTNNLSYIPIHPQHNFMRNAQVCVTYYICDAPLISYTSMQTLGGRDHELWSNGHLSGIDSAGTYPVNNADALPPARYTGTMGNEDPPHVVSVHSISLRAPFADGGCA